MYVTIFKVHGIFNESYIMQLWMKIKTQVWNTLENAQMLWKRAVLEDKSYSGVASQDEKLFSVLLIAIDTKNLISILKKNLKHLRRRQWGKAPDTFDHTGFRQNKEASRPASPRDVSDPL